MRKEEGGRMKEDGGRRKEDGGRRKEERGRRKKGEGRREEAGGKIRGDGRTRQIKQPQLEECGKTRQRKRQRSIRN